MNFIDNKFDKFCQDEDLNQPDEDSNQDEMRRRTEVKVQSREAAKKMCVFAHAGERKFTSHLARISVKAQRSRGSLHATSWTQSTE